MIKARGPVKRHGATAAVSDHSFTIRPGLATGSPGSNEATRPHHAADQGLNCQNGTPVAYNGMPLTGCPAHAAHTRPTGPDQAQSN